MSKAKAFVAVDLGASGGKVSLGTFEGRSFTLRDVHRFPNGGISVWAKDLDGTVAEKTYWDDLALYANIVDGLRKAAAASDAPIVAMGIDTWGADAAVLNRHGESLGPVYCYRDHRLDTIREQLFEHVSARELFDRSGIPAQPWYLVNQLFWLFRNRPELKGVVRTVLPIPTLLQYYLCGSMAAEATWIAVQQLCKVGTAEYDDRLLAAAGIPRNILPPVVPPGTIVGELRPEIARDVGLPGLQVVAVKTHDTASAYTAAPVRDRSRSLIISSGTWSLVGKLVERPLVNDAAFEGHLANEGVVGDIRLLRNVMGTWPVQRLRDGWSQEDGQEIPWEDIVRMARSARPLQTVLDVDDPSLYNPADMEQALREQVRRTGQREPADRASLLRAVYEGLAIKVAQVNALLATATGTIHEVVHVVGGGARNPLLNQFIADATGLPVEAGPYEATCIGNILVQAAACGGVPSLADGQQIVAENLPTERFAPSREHDWSAAATKLAALQMGR